MPQVDLDCVARMAITDYLVILFKVKMESQVNPVNKVMQGSPDLLVNQALQDNIFALVIHVQHQSLAHQDLTENKVPMETKVTRVVLVYVVYQVFLVKMLLLATVQKLLGQTVMMVYLEKMVKKVLLVCLVYPVRMVLVGHKDHLAIKVSPVNLAELVV